jgi:hypothetical protein
MSRLFGNLHRFAAQDGLDKVFLVGSCACNSQELDSGCEKPRERDVVSAMMRKESGSTTSQPHTFGQPRYRALGSSSSSNLLWKNSAASRTRKPKSGDMGPKTVEHALD